MNQGLTLVKQADFGDISCGFWEKDEEIWMTREQIGTALGYAEPSTGIRLIHDRHRDRIDQYSTVVKLTTVDGKEREAYLYSAKGVYEICRWSRQPKADAFMDFVWDVVEDLRTGRYRYASRRDDELMRLVLEGLNRLTAIIEEDRRRTPGREGLIYPIHPEAEADYRRYLSDENPKERHRTHYKVDKAPFREELIRRIISGKHTFNELEEWTREQGFPISSSSLHRYATQGLYAGKISSDGTLDIVTDNGKHVQYEQITKDGSTVKTGQKK